MTEFTIKSRTVVEPESVAVAALLQHKRRKLRLVTKAAHAAHLLALRLAWIPETQRTHLSEEVNGKLA